MNWIGLRSGIETESCNFVVCALQKQQDSGLVPDQRPQAYLTL